MRIIYIYKSILFLMFHSIIFSQITSEANLNLFANDNHTHFLNKNKNGLYSDNESHSNILFKHNYKNNKSNNNSELVWTISNEKINIISFSTNFDFKKINLKLGSFEPERIYFNEQSSGSMVFSNNSKKIYGASINSKWINFYKFFDIKTELFQGKFPSQNNYESGPYLHYKSVLIRKNIKNSDLGFVVKHAVQFGGFDSDNEKIPSTFKNFINVFFSRTGDSSQPQVDQDYRAGNGLGSFTLYFENNKNFNIYYEHYFDDKSGVKTLNFGDGLLGFNIKSNKIKFNFEIIDTRNQSGNQHPPGIDSYYFHQVYLFGWSNKGLTIGNSFIYPNSNRKFVYNLGLKYINKKSILDLRYANSKVYLPYQNKNNNLPFENHTSVISKDNYVFLKYEFLLNKNKSISFGFSKENDLTNFLFNYKIKL